MTIADDKKTATVTVTVKNTGDVAGKSVVEVYASVPYTDYDRQNGVEKAAVQLMDFEKSSTLQPGASQTITMKVDLANLASYDANGAKTYIVDPGDYYFAIGTDAHDALNNVLAAQGKTVADGMTADGNAAKTYKWTWTGDVDKTTFAVGKNGTAITNQLTEGDYAMDYNAFEPGTVTYLSRADWNGTFPKTYSGLTANATVSRLLNNDLYTLKTDDDVSDLIFGDTTSTLTINDMKNAPYDDPRWEELVNKVTVAEFLDFSANAFHNIQGIASVNMPQKAADDGPGGSDSHYLNEGGYQGVPYADAADYTSGTRVAPSPVNLAYAWNKELAFENGEIILGESTLVLDLPIMIGPGMNIHRHAYNARGVEYYSEDPILSGYVGSAVVQGAQSKGTLVNIKHMGFNDQEINRSGVAVFMNEQKARELELRNLQQAFEGNGKPASFEGDATKDNTYTSGARGVMTSYNRLNGEWAGQNADLIRRILRGELGFRGCVMSDWSSVNDTEKVVKSGQNVEMPGRKEFFGEVRALLKEGRITEKDIEKMIRPNIATSIAFGLYDREKYVPALLEKFPAHKQTGYDVAAEGIVLLRNNGILPLAEGRKILLTGRFTEQIPRTGGSTSSSAEVLGYDNVTLTAALREVYGDAVRVVEKPSREELAAADVVLLSTGTIDVESFERPFALPKEEEAFIRTAVESNPNTIVLVNSGSGIRMGGWNDKAAAVIYGWYPGQSGFTALADILSGKLSPSGKLPMTIEKEFNDSPAKGTMPAGAEFYNKAPRAYNERLIQLYDIDYKESVLVGYRWYETKGIAPLYPFGFGLSYTTFELSKPRAPKVFPADKPLKVSVTLTNTGDREGAEVVQLYVTENAPTVLRPKKELKGFRKVTLAPGKSAVVEFELDRQALAFWDTQSRGWKVNPGEYTLSLGTSSADIAATLPVSVK